MYRSGPSIQHVTWIFILISLSSLGASQSTSDLKLAFRSLGSFEATDVAFMNLGNFGTDPDLLLLTGFGLLSGQISYLPNVSSFLDDLSQANPILISDDINWPNEFQIAPAKAIPNRKIAAVAGGFLVPLHQTGAINLVDFTSGTPSSPFQITVDKSGFFYHRVRWYDADGDSNLDIITARADYPIFESAIGELVFFKNPGSNALGQTWQETVLTNGPDIFFEFIDIDSNGVPEIVAAEFLSQNLVIYWTDSGFWNDTSSINSVVIDATLGPLFDVKVADLNMDGKPDLLVTNHVSETERSGIWAYEYPQNWKTDPWIKHIIRIGFVTREGGYNQASPGGALPFRPFTRGPLTKPWILLSGDGSQEAYLFTPYSSSTSNWSYSSQVVILVNGTVGQITAGDVNGDGYTEFFVPDYDHGLVYGFTFAP
eukprot:TRINITY_DN8232_c0_g1_i1.p1 TRINITY_DN8232_c0_g1~~TRINITY_DN8232_c0_g1_i1.p1  ORF type:complete len:427 (+),score=72.14 TRINITY_DN8232_c0_g1_i1:50-1330(+)